MIGLPQGARRRIGAGVAGAGLAALAAVANAGEDSRSLNAAMRDFAAAVADTAAAVQRDPFFADEDSRALGAAYWAQMMIRTLEQEIIGDLDHPLFRIVDFRTREGGDNPDQRYLVTRIRSGTAYRIWGQRGSQRRLEVQLYAGLPWSQTGGHLIGALAQEQIRFGRDGRFEIRVGTERESGNWIENPAGEGEITVMVRQIFSDWRRERAGEVHIDRIGYEGRPKPPLTTADIAARIDRAAAELRSVVPLWPDFVRRQYLDRMPANTLSPPFDPGALGGVKGRWMAVGHFDLAEDEALVLDLPPTAAHYQGVQLTDLWFSSLEYANRQTSLSAHQSFRTTDGRRQLVIAHRDPGVQNWLDTTGLRRGVILLRYDGLNGEPLPESQWPALRQVRVPDLRAALAPETPVYGTAQREAALAERRRHVQQRFGV